MKNKLLLALIFVMGFSSVRAQLMPDFSMIGYAAMSGEGNFNNAGGTTGGKGGKIVCPKDFKELKVYAESANPYIILIDKEITTGNPCNVDVYGNVVASGGAASTYGEVLKLTSNKTLLGIGDKAFLNRIGLVIQAQSNIIIRNIKFSMRNVPVSKTDENKIIAWRNGAEVILSDPDCIGIQADLTSAKVDYGHHYWVDHCEFFNGDAPNKDRYDGLLDMKNNVQYVTISWCHFHDHDKACLSGKGNSDNYPRTVTMHHNYFHNIEGSRLPLQRGGIYHYFNNMQEGCSDGYDLREGAVGYVEKCYFKNTKAPVMPGGGEATLVDLFFENCKRIPGEYAVDGVKYDELYTIPTSTYRPPYAYTADAVADVPTIVPQYAGIGKIADEYSVEDAVDDLENAGSGSSSGGGDDSGNEDSELGTPIVWNFSNWTNATLTSAFEKDGLTVSASAANTVVIESNSAKIGSDSYSKRLKTGGAGVAGEHRTLSFDVEGSGRVQIGACSSNSSQTRELAITSNNGADTLAVKTIGTAAGYVYFDYDAAKPATISLASKASGINFYRVSWTPFLTSTDIKDELTTKEVRSTEYYNLNGVKLQAPATGVNIVRVLYDDGSVNVSKIVLD